MRKKTIFIFTLGLTVTFGLGLWIGLHFSSLRTTQDRYFTRAAETISIFYPLVALRDGDVQLATQKLESFLNVALYQLYASDLDKMKDGGAKESIQGLLKEIKEYRLNYPYSSGIGFIDAAVSNFLGCADTQKPNQRVEHADDADAHP